MLHKGVLEHLSLAGISPSDTALRDLKAYCELVRVHNATASLVSMGDAAKLEEVHVPDSLALVGYIKSEADEGAAWIDIGSGGGFPAIPIKILLPYLPLVMVERSVKKADLLRKMLHALQLEAEVVSCQFPQEYPHPPGRVVMTARAVEKAVNLHRRLGKWMKKNDIFFCQAADAKAFAPAVFHVEQLEDAWSALGLRRGNLWRIVRR